MIKIGISDQAYFVDDRVLIRIYIYMYLLYCYCTLMKTLLAHQSNHITLSHHYAAYLYIVVY